MASIYSKLRDELTDDLEGQVSRLQKEVASLRKTLAKQGSNVYADTRDSASDLYDDLAGRLADAMPGIRRQSRMVRQTASDYPVTTAIVGVAIIGLIVGFLTRR